MHCVYRVIDDGGAGSRSGELGELKLGVLGAHIRSAEEFMRR